MQHSDPSSNPFILRARGEAEPADDPAPVALTRRSATAWLHRVILDADAHTHIAYLDAANKVIATVVLGTRDVDSAGANRAAREIIERLGPMGVASIAVVELRSDPAFKGKPASGGRLTRRLALAMGVPEVRIAAQVTIERSVTRKTQTPLAETGLF